MLKVLHLCSEKGWRGGEQQVAYLVLELQKLGVESFLAVKKESDLERFCQKNSLRYFHVSFSNSVDIKSALRVKNICASNAIDIIHMHTSKAHGIGVLSAAFGNKTKMILSRRVDFKLKTNPFSKWKYNHPAIKRILCVSNKIKEIVQLEVRHKEKCVTVYSGVDIDKFSTRNLERNALRAEFNIDPDKILIGNTSALADHKDYFTFIDTISQLVILGKAVHAFIIGDGALRADLEKYSNELGLGQNLTFTGFRNDITNILPCLDIFLMTSKEEGLGTSILDAFSARVPVVATNAGGIPEMVFHEETGMLGTVGNSQMLAKWVTTLIDNPDLKQRIVSNAYELVKKFSKEETARKTLEIYTEVLN
jgi:glycosyltransferase involved in cell wall biosynthesis